MEARKESQRAKIPLKTGKFSFLLKISRRGGKAPPLQCRGSVSTGFR